MSPESRRRSLTDHVADCESCGAEMPLDRIAALLEQSEPNVEAPLLSRRTLAELRPELRAQAARALRRRVSAALLVSLPPLILVAAYDALFLGVLHRLLGVLLPEPLVTYLIINYAAAVLLLLGATYAAIPILVARQRAASELA